MIFADTHTHLYLDDFSPENEEVVHRAIVCGVKKLIFPNVDLSTIEPMKRLHESFPQNTFMAMGLHPTEVNENWKKNLEEIEKINPEIDKLQKAKKKPADFEDSPEPD